MDQVNRISPVGIGLLVAIMLGVSLLVARTRTNDHHLSQIDTWQRIRRDGVVRIGYANEAPYGYLDTTSGEITGEAPEIARAVLRRLGIKKVEPVVTEFGALIPGLRAGRFDMIAAGMYITPTRCQQISFSNPTYKIGEAFAVRRGNPLRLHSFEDVARHPTAKLGVVGGAIEHTYAREVGVPESRIVVFPDNISALAAVRTGRIDASAATSLTIYDLLRKARSTELEQAYPFYEPVIDGRSVLGYGAFGLRKGDETFRHALNRELARFIGSSEHLQLTKSFGITEASLPGTVTAGDLCQGRLSQ